MQYRVALCESVPQTVLRLEWEVRRDRLGTDIAAGMYELTASVQRAGLTACGAPTITYRDEPVTDKTVEVDFGVPVDLGTALSPQSGAEVVVQSGCLVARTCHRGGYDGLDSAYRALREWLRESGYRAVGPPTEAYLIGPDEVSDPARLITEIRLPVAPCPVITTRMRTPFAEALRLTRETLTRHGFELVAETDMKLLMRTQLDEQISEHVVLGVCHPLVTAQALAVALETGWASLSTVVVRAADGGTLIEAQDPSILPQALEGTALPVITAQLRNSLVTALDSLRTPARSG